MTTAQQLLRIKDWKQMQQAIASNGGQLAADGNDDHYLFPDGSECIIPCLRFVTGRLSHRSERNSPRVILQWPRQTVSVREAIAGLQFREAKTMPHIPHEYTSRILSRKDGDYVTLFHAVMQSRMIGIWAGTRGTLQKAKPLRYLQVDGWWYWSMSSRRTQEPINEGRHPLWMSHHINRCTDEAFRKSNTKITEVDS
jgi:hypothetical protein